MITGPSSSPPRRQPPEPAWSRAIIWFGVTLLVSLGLCGLNFVTVLGINAEPFGQSQHGPRQVLVNTLVVLGYLEVIGMFVGLLGLVVSLLGAGISALLARRKSE